MLSLFKYMFTILWHDSLSHFYVKDWVNTLFRLLSIELLHLMLLNSMIVCTKRILILFLDRHYALWCDLGWVVNCLVSAFASGEVPHFHLIIIIDTDWISSDLYALWHFFLYFLSQTFESDFIRVHMRVIGVSKSNRSIITYVLHTLASPIELSLKTYCIVLTSSLESGCDWSLHWHWYMHVLLLV